MKKNLTIIIISALVSSMVFGLGTVLLKKFDTKAIATINLNDDYNIIAGVIRNSGEGWRLIQDSGHETVGIISVEQDDQRITVKYDKNSKVNALSCTVDETMASEGYTVGASVGIDKTWIYIYDKDKKLVNPKDYSNKSGNIWIEGIFKR